MLGISVRKVHELAREGSLAYLNAGRARRFSMEVVEEFMRARAVGSASDQAIVTENRKEQAYNCLGNLHWMIDAYLIWVKEMIDMGGDYSPGPDIHKASKEELDDYVRRTRSNIRVMQAAVDAARHYER